MYLGKYPDTNGLPPGYHGVAYAHDDEAHDTLPGVCTEQDRASTEKVCEPCTDPCSDECQMYHEGVHKTSGLLEHIFAHKINMEDLLLLGLIALLLNSGADTDLIVMLALLFVLGL